MDVYKLKDLAEDDRKLVLESEALSVEELGYTKRLSEEELQIKREDLANAAIKKAMIEDEFAEIKAQFKDRLEPVNITLKESIEAVKNRSVSIMGKVYKLADYENQMIHVVDPVGNVISSRRMLPEERQFRIQTAKAI